MSITEPTRDAKPPTPDEPGGLADALARADAARDAGVLAEWLAAAESAWAAAEGAAPALRQRAGLSLMQAAYRSGRLARVVELGDRVLPLLREAALAAAATSPAPADATLRLIDTLRMAALCAADTNRFAASLAWGQEAHRLALQAGERGRISLATNVLGCFFERAGDPWQAERLLLEALALGRGLDDPHPAFVALNNLGGVLIGKYYLLRDALPADEARQTLVTARPFIEEAAAVARQRGEPFFMVFALGNLAETLVHLGEPDAAEPLLSEAEALAAQHGFTAQRWRLGCTRGELQLSRGQAEAAFATLQAVLAECAQADQRTTHLRLHHALWRAATALGRTADALHHLQASVALERARTATQLRAQSELFVTRMEAEQARQEAERQRERAHVLEVDVRRDPLTGLGNRRELDQRWPEYLRRARDDGLALSVAMLDLDHFKAVNDRHGHAVGDAVLQAVARLLREHTRATDVVARVGGEEFLLVLPELGAVRAAEVCERLRAQLQAHDWAALSPGLAVTASIGLASTPPAEPGSLILRADAALYRAKAEGRNRLVAM